MNAFPHRHLLSWTPMDERHDHLGADELGADDLLAPPTFERSSYNLFGPQAPPYETFGEPFERIPESPQRRRLRLAFGLLVAVVFGLPLVIAIVAIVVELLS